MNDDDQTVLLDALEFCDDEDIEDVVESVLDVLEDYGIVFEKKTEAEYRRRQFDKHYKFKQDPNDKNKGTIEIDGEKYNVVRDDVSAAYDDGTIHLNKKRLLKMKGAKERDAILQHEVGHLKLHGRTLGTNPHLDRSKTNKKIANDVIMNPGQSMVMLNGEDVIKTAASRYKTSKNAKNRHFMNRTRKQEDHEKTKLRESYRGKMNKHSDPGTHWNTNEFEADQYAANRTGKSTIKRGLRRYYKASPLESDNTIKNIDRAISRSRAEGDTDIAGLYENLKRETIKDQKRRRSVESTGRSKDLHARNRALENKSISRKERDVY